MKKIREVIVVEGKSDTQRIQNIIPADTIETNGSAIDDETIELIEKAHQLRGVIVFTDPDFPGEKIRKTITQRIPDVKHAFISQKDAKSSGPGSLGVEHASRQAILEALDKASCREIEISCEDSDITFAFLNQHHLINGPGAKLRRQLLGDYLNIGYTNGKQLKKRLDMFSITQKEVVDALEKINKGINNDE